MAFKKGTKAYCMFGMKCPRCHEGDLFETSTFSMQKPFDMHKRCPSCNQNYMPEPGFYYGSMYISYVFVAWFCIAFVALFHWILDWGIYTSFFLLILILTIFFVWIFRISRSIWIALNVKYDGQYPKKK